MEDKAQKSKVKQEERKPHFSTPSLFPSKESLLRSGSTKRLTPDKGILMEGV